MGPPILPKLSFPMRVPLGLEKLSSEKIVEVGVVCKSCGLCGVYDMGQLRYNGERMMADAEPLDAAYSFGEITQAVQGWLRPG